MGFGVPPKITLNNQVGKHLYGIIYGNHQKMAKFGFDSLQSII